jgi:hypothetical protein
MDLRARLDRLRAERVTIAETRSVATIEVELQRAQHGAATLWRATAGCRDVTLPESGQTCAPFWRCGRRSEPRSGATRSKPSYPIARHDSRACRPSRPPILRLKPSQASSIGQRSGWSSLPLKSPHGSCCRNGVDAADCRIGAHARSNSVAIGSTASARLIAGSVAAIRRLDRGCTCRDRALSSQKSCARSRPQMHRGEQRGRTRGLFRVPSSAIWPLESRESGGCRRETVSGDRFSQSLCKQTMSHRRRGPE